MRREQAGVKRSREAGLLLASLPLKDGVRGKNPGTGATLISHPPRAHWEPHGSFPSPAGRDGAVLKPATRGFWVPPTVSFCYVAMTNSEPQSTVSQSHCSPPVVTGPQRSLSGMCETLSKCSVEDLRRAVSMKYLKPPKVSQGLI